MANRLMGNINTPSNTLGNENTYTPEGRFIYSELIAFTPENSDTTEVDASKISKKVKINVKRVPHKLVLRKYNSDTLQYDIVEFDGSENKSIDVELNDRYYFTLISEDDAQFVYGLFRNDTQVGNNIVIPKASKIINQTLKVVSTPGVPYLDSVVGEHYLDIELFDNSHIYCSLKQVDDLLATKVDKEVGKGLSTNDYSDTEKENVLLNTQNRHNHTNKEVLDSITSIDNIPTEDSNLPVSSSGVKSYVDEKCESLDEAKVDKVQGKQLSANDFTDTLKTKLDNIENNAQVNTIEVIKDSNGNTLSITNKAVQLNKSTIGLSNVDNTSDANKPISTLQQAALNEKVDKVQGKSLSSNDFTDSDVTKLSGIESNAQVNILEGIKDANNNDLPITDKKVQINKTSVGLSNVDNTSDLNKPISTAQQDELNKKVDKVSGKGLSTNDFTNSFKSKIENNELDINALIEKISNLASSSNKLLSESEVNDRVLAQAARPITKTASGSPFNTYSELINASAYYSGGELITLTKNDYAVVVGDESSRIYTIYLEYAYFTSTSEYVDYAVDYNGSKVVVTSSNKDSLGITPGTTIAYDFEDPTARYVWFNNWQFQYIINSTTLTPQQIVAINSGITRTLTDQITTNKNNITSILGYIDDIISDIESIEGALTSKVDKETGKGLSTNDFNDTYKNDVTSNTSARHTHTNKSLLDNISSTNLISASERTTWNGKQDTLTFDDTPTQSSNNPVKSSGVKSYVDNTASSLQSKITSTNKVSSDLIDDTNATNKFVTSTEKADISSNTSARHSHNNKTVLDSINSSSLVSTSDRTSWNAKQNALTFDSTPTSESNNPVSSKGIKSYVDNQLNGLQSKITSTNKLSSDLVSDASSTNKFITSQEKTDIASNTNARHSHSNKDILDYVNFYGIKDSSGDKVEPDTSHYINLSKSLVGLSNVDNTSDASKPVSIATQSALDLKLNLSGGTLTGALKLTTLQNATNSRTLISYSSNTITLGDSSDALSMYGSSERPTYTYNSVAKSIAFTSDLDDKQASDTKLTSISNLSNTSTGLIKMTNGVASLDTSPYLTSISGAVSGTLTGSTSYNIGNSSTGRFNTIYATNLNGSLPYCSSASGNMYNPTGHFKVVVTSSVPSSFSSNTLYIIK